MTKTEADKIMTERFEDLQKRAEVAKDTAELIAVTDGMLKMYITLVNSDCFGSDKPLPTNGIIN